MNELLVISRKLNERLYIGEEVQLVILDVEDGRVKVGIEAPRAIRIIRGELLDAVSNENKQASTNQADGWLQFFSKSKEKPTDFSCSERS